MEVGPGVGLQRNGDRSAGGVDGFALVATDLRPGVREIRIWGELDFADADRLSQALERDGQHVVLDLADCGFIDSVALKIILRAHRRAAEHGRRVLVCGAHGQAGRLFDVSGVAGLGIVFRRCSDALLSLEETA